jgi:hypothetical protein
MTVLAYVDLTPYLFCGNVVVVAWILALAAVVARRSRAAAITLTSLVLVPSVAFWIAFALFTGVKREMAFDMEWSYGEKSQSYPDADNIVLRFKSHPNHEVGIYSRNLGKYLETLPSPDVRVVFQVTLDFGRTRGFHAVQIGELRSWDSVNGYAGVCGNSEPSPWPRGQRRRKRRTRPATRLTVLRASLPRQREPARRVP